MENKGYNSELRALLSARNFSKSLDKHYEQMMIAQKSLVDLHKKGLSIIEVNCSPEALEEWNKSLLAVNRSVYDINEILRTAKAKIESTDNSDSINLGYEFEEQINKFLENHKNVGIVGYHILPVEAHKHWEKDFCNFEDTIFPLIILYANTCRLELQMIEKYLPNELDELTKIVFKHIPENFTFEEADAYERDYYLASQNLRNEFKEKKNLWDRFLDVLAGGTHQTASQRVMMQRWLDGEKKDL